MPKYEQTRRHFYVNLGYTTEGGRSQPKFNLGSDAREAMVREARLVRMWETIKASGPAVWSGAELHLAKAVARGDDSATLPEPPPEFRHGEALVAWVRRFHDRFGSLVAIRPHDEPALQAALDGARERLESLRHDFRELVADDHRGTAVILDQMDERPDLMVILDAYSKAQEAVIRNSGDPGQNAVTKITRAKTLSRLFGQVTLATADDLRGIADRLANPALKSGHGRVMAPTTRRDLWKTLKEALGMADDRGVPLPRGWHKVRVKLPKENRIDKLAQWTVPELAALLRHADGVYRAVILLGLNCGWQEADCRDVEDGHLFLDRSLPVIIGQRAGAQCGDAWIMMVRTKNGCPGLHKLWPETAAAVRELVERRDRIVRATERATARLFIRLNGNPMSSRTAGNNPGRQFSNDWTDLLAKAGTAQRLPVKYLRKASADYLREFATDDVVSIAQRRVKASGDTMMARYANLPWKRVAEATDKLRERLAEVFSTE